MPLKMFSPSQNTPFSGIKQTLAIAAGKGGVGKSTVAVNLALALQQVGLKVGLLDADIYGPSLRKMLPEEKLPTQNGEKIYPAITASGLSIISMAYFRNALEATAVRAPIANGIISQFIKNVEWGQLDYLLIDFPPGTGDIQLTLSQQASLTGALMVTTPQEVALLDVRKAINLFEQVKVPMIGVVENMSYYYHEASQEKIYLFGQGGGERLAQEKGIPFLGGIPIDSMISRCGDMGKSLLTEAAQTPAVKAFQEIAQKIIKQTDKSEGLGSFELAWKEMPVR